MEPLRELNQIRAELDKLRENATASTVMLSTLHATTDKRFDHILFCLESMRTDIAVLNTSVSALQTLANEGESSLKTLLWFGGVMAGVTTFILTIINYFPK